MYYLIALGNPGSKYTQTRHNVAWIILDHLFEGEWSFNKYMNADSYTYMSADQELLCLKPQTYMNNSGEVIGQLKKEDPDLNNN